MAGNVGALLPSIGRAEVPADDKTIGSATAPSVTMPLLPGLQQSAEGPAAPMTAPPKKPEQPAAQRLSSELTKRRLQLSENKEQKHPGNASNDQSPQDLQVDSKVSARTISTSTASEIASPDKSQDVKGNPEDDDAASEGNESEVLSLGEEEKDEFGDFNQASSLSGFAGFSGLSGG
eukprot:Skav235295  [mRNA]  locus=scaffold4363:93326:94164:- [translate_table: standard]